jgi:hypothetical protein
MTNACSSASAGDASLRVETLDQTFVTRVFRPEDLDRDVAIEQDVVAA